MRLAPNPAILTLVVLLVIAPGAAASVYDVEFTDPEGDVTSDKTGATQEGDWGWVDVRKVVSRVVNDQVEVRVTLGDLPHRYAATYYLTIDTDGDGSPDVSVDANEGGGSIHGEAVYWSAYPEREGNDLVYTLKPAEKEGWTAESFGAKAWLITFGSKTYSGTDTVGDKAEGGNKGSGLLGAPSPTLPAALAALALAAALAARHRLRP